jgi:hypothetical protein
VTFEESPDPEHIEWVTDTQVGDPDRDTQEVWKPAVGDSVTATRPGLIAEVDDQGILVRYEHGAVQKFDALADAVERREDG